MYPMDSMAFDMAYWKLPHAFWIGKGLTYLLGLIAIIFLVIVVGKRNKEVHIDTFLAGFIIFCGFVWTLFTAIAGISGM